VKSACVEYGGRLTERLRFVAGGRSYRDIARATGFNAETVRRYFCARGSVPAAFLASFCRAYRVSADWMLLGLEQTAEPANQNHLNGADSPRLTEGHRTGSHSKEHEREEGTNAPAAIKLSGPLLLLTVNPRGGGRRSPQPQAPCAEEGPLLATPAQ
jgi:hypothetical protein